MANWSPWWELIPVAITVAVVAVGVLLLVWAAREDGRENDLAHGIRRRVPHRRR